MTPDEALEQVRRIISGTAIESGMEPELIGDSNADVIIRALNSAGWSWIKMTEQEHSEDIRDLSAEIKRGEMRYQLMSQQLAEHVRDNTIMRQVLNTAMIMIDQLLTDLRLAGGTPSKELIHAKLNFDVAMKRLFKEESDDQPRDPPRA